MNILQSWLIVGIPGLALAAGLFVGHSAVRAQVGYVVLAAIVVFFAVVPGDIISAAVIGLVGVGLIAAGRGTGRTEQAPEHHENRKRLTTAAHEG